MTDEQLTETTEPEDPTAQTAPEGTEEAPLYGVGPFTIREVALLGVWVVAFVVSFWPVSEGVLGRALGGGQSVWTAGLDWVLTIGVPTVAVFLVVLRRFSPQGIRRVGSLGIDQFASVAFSVSAVVWLTWLWQNVALAIGEGVWIRSWVVWVEFFVTLAGVVLTVLAPFIPPFRADFEGRPESPAHRNARAVRPVTSRPPRPEPVAEYAPADTGAVPTGEASAYDSLGFAETGTYATVPPAETEDWSPHYSRSADGASDESAYGGSQPEQEITASEPVAEPAGHVHQAFWALAPVERDVYDERGVPIFRIGPTAWALVIEDRGSLFVIRHEDGRIGYLHDVSGVTRG